MAFRFQPAMSSPPPHLRLPTCSLQSRVGQTPLIIIRNKKKQQQRRRRLRVVGDLSHLRDVVSKDFEFLKKGFSRGVVWANDTFGIPQLAKPVDDVLWLRFLEEKEDPANCADVELPDWPRPSYPELTGVDLLMADLKALETYASYFYYWTKTWSKPLPESYDAQDVADYFSRRPHVIAFRVIEIFSALASATIRIRATSVGKFLKSSPDKHINGDISQFEFGMVLKETMLHLGPTFIKVGQSLSTRPDIIGTEISKALSELHDRIPPFPRKVAMKIIEEELGSPAESIFSYISEEPIAAASFGQVYRGTTLDGFDVAVKVQRPDLLHVVVRDVYILRLGLGLYKKIAKRKSDPRVYADELGKGFVGELDYNLEAANAFKFKEAHSSFTFMRVPKVFRHLSQKRVLTMEWVVGESPTDLLSISTGADADYGSAYSERQRSEAKRRLFDLVSKGVEASLVQLLETGLLHADPHPGNLRYTSSGQIGFLDFGLLCQMQKKHQFAMLASILHIINGDWASLVQSLVEMDVVKPGTNTLRVTMELEDSLGDVEYKNGIPDVKFSKVLGKVWSIALKYHFRMPPYYTLLLRSLASLEGLAVAADPTFKTFDAAYPYVVRKLLTDNSPETRRILHMVILNKRKEFQWKRLALFLRVGSIRKVLNRLISSPSESPQDLIPNRPTGVFDVAHLILTLLPSKDGVVLRKLLMTADGASLVRKMVSNDATFFRQQLCLVIADVLSQWMLQVLGQDIMVSRYSLESRLTRAADLKEPCQVSISDWELISRDRRLKVIISKTLGSARKDPILMLKLCWTSFVMGITALTLACHRVIVSLSETYLGRLSLVPKKVAISA